MKRISHWMWLAIAVFAVACAIWGIAFISRRDAVPPAMGNEKHAPSDEQESHDSKTVVRVVHPKKGLLERLTTQPGSVQAYESVRLYAKVPGFLKWQRTTVGNRERPLDIGDDVKKGQKLAVVDVPELEAQLRRNVAGVKQAEARITQTKSRVRSAKADLEAAKAAVTRSIANEKSAAAWVRFRSLQLHRMEGLFAVKSIEEKLVDEAKEHYEASVETSNAAHETIAAEKAKAIAADAKIDSAQADVDEAKAEKEVAQAEVEKSQVQVAFATISAPFDGVVTQRHYFEGDFIRAANESGNEPLLTVERTDVMRVIVQIPDRDVPFTDPGDDAIVQIDALPGMKFPAKVARIAKYEDPLTRLMRVEIDLPNPTGKIRHGMYGQVTIILDQEKDLLSIPSSCVASKSDDGKGFVFVVRDGHAHKVAVRLGADNGLLIGVTDGLTRDDQVINNPGALSDGAEVSVLSP